jgi:hypothetical protein
MKRTNTKFASKNHELLHGWPILIFQGSAYLADDQFLVHAAFPENSQWRQHDLWPELFKLSPRGIIRARYTQYD